MKKLFFLLVLSILASSLISTAQIIRFTDTTNRWKASNTIYPNDDPIAISVEYFSDDSLTEKNGFIYTTISREAGPVMYVREDTVTRKVYVIPIDWEHRYMTVTDTNEFVYMDFGMQVGDTLNMPVVLYWDGSNDTFSVHVVHSIDSQRIGTQWRKRMQMEAISGMSVSGTNFPNPYLITEGIGPNSGVIIEPQYNGNEWGPYTLSCFSNKGVVTAPPFSQHCFDPLVIDEFEKKTFVCHISQSGTPLPHSFFKRGSAQRYARNR